MAAKTPSHIPQENVYDRLHWLIYPALAVSVLAVGLVVATASGLFA